MASCGCGSKQSGLALIREFLLQCGGASENALNPVVRRLELSVCMARRHLRAQTALQRLLGRSDWSSVRDVLFYGFSLVGFVPHLLVIPTHRGSEIYRSRHPQSRSDARGPARPPARGCGSFAWAPRPASLRGPAAAPQLRGGAARRPRLP